MNLRYDALVERIVQWAVRGDDIRLVVIIGSRARTDRPADLWSDLDLLVFTTNPDLYLSSTTWLSEFGEHHLTFLESTAVGDFVERRVLFDDGLDVDFIPLPMNVIEGDVVPEMSGVLQRGYRVLVDKDGFRSKLEDAAGVAKDFEVSAPIMPTDASFLHLANDFLYHAVWSAKKLCRGELWTARMCCDGLMKRQLLQMMEWHHQACIGLLDTWHEGRFLDSWADPSVLNDVRQSFCVYDVDSVWTALLTTVDVFGGLGKKLAGQLRYEYPTDAHDYVVSLLQGYREMNAVGTVDDQAILSQPDRKGS
ncbi:aminoglycoside 6-adenylyltransferase [Alicyclobacillus sp. ALC3]|uniref:aminoglycoside 6-adenylyltransferase n=1 Tax=Alicyclobacillus sp. ALC3 TaxID=2796143 RepID=UPI0023796417|nr:aminoglycoside 6-adenylyltransferase [Alicyclobacillus sp. ALC3]WDL97060.1 aminoglycoside 6-adenylyltransferase [Alicyclobacillus sp. ALC3]